MIHLGENRYNCSTQRAMGLNIKNDESCRLARELARLTGESMTGAITVALREPLLYEGDDFTRTDVAAAG